MMSYKHLGKQLLLSLGFAYISVNSVLADDSLVLSPVLEGLPPSWAVAASPDNDMYITHREGGLSIINSALERRSVAFLPDDLLSGGQGGLLDIAFHPEFITNGWIYLSYSAGTANSNALKVVRFKLVGEQVQELEDIFVAHDKKDTPVHYGGRLAFDADNALYISTGDGFDYREKAQLNQSHLGKIIRVTDIGDAHPRNPFFTGQTNSASFIYSLGHRNPQGLLVTKNNRLISHEHGPAGGDEINIIASGKNYGWPVITNGMDYIGATISPFTEYEGMEQPALDWTPSIAPSGMIHYTHDKFASLSEHLLVTSLKFQQIYAVAYADGVIGEQKIVLNESGIRLRDIETDADGDIWILGDGEQASLFKVLRK
ncbi:PQQ-dependent sugar dehydrogenase [Glaciecola sp. XM2]|uniref:PQQ-dependent sugar dehydrogenase n=1 Tax=Glaciecola sp. XM2 TaxID=1914931 RepID=UPI001BDE6F88|nr:PQQ-dependent sugar dehydrogenase [Glaciecola sp. XM2]MBT1451046.1 PQQ-dependent sugar dehydrogenase [Glaciecola sp. XM2]